MTPYARETFKSQTGQGRKRQGGRPVPETHWGSVHDFKHFLQAGTWRQRQMELFSMPPPFVTRGETQPSQGPHPTSPSVRLCDAAIQIHPKIHREGQLVSTEVGRSLMPVFTTSYLDKILITAPKLSGLTFINARPPHRPRWAIGLSSWPPSQWKLIPST